MTSLRRTRTGDFSIESAHTLEELDQLNETERAAFLLPTEKLFIALPKITLPEFFERLARSGCEIYQKKIGTSFPIGTRVRICGKNGFFSVGEVREYPDGTAIKSLKLFG